MEPHAEHNSNSTSFLLLRTQFVFAATPAFDLRRFLSPTTVPTDIPKCSQCSVPHQLISPSWLLTIGTVSSVFEPSQDRLHPRCLACDIIALSLSGVRLATPSFVAGSIQHSFLTPCWLLNPFVCSVVWERMMYLFRQTTHVLLHQIQILSPMRLCDEGCNLKLNLSSKDQDPLMVPLRTDSKLTTPVLRAYHACHMF